MAQDETTRKIGKKWVVDLSKDGSLISWHAENIKTGDTIADREDGETHTFGYAMTLIKGWIKEFEAGKKKFGLFYDGRQYLGD